MAKVSSFTSNYAKQGIASYNGGSNGGSKSSSNSGSTGSGSKKKNKVSSFTKDYAKQRDEIVKSGQYERYGTYTSAPRQASQGPQATQMAAPMSQDNPYMKAAVRQMLPAYQRPVDPITAAAANMLRNNARGNIDLYNRPQYRQPDGSISTINSISIGTDEGAIPSVNGKGMEVLIPTIGRDKNGRPVQWTDEQAIENYRKTGENLGKFNTVEEANDYAEKLHRQQEAYYSPENGPLRLNNMAPKPYKLGDAVKRFESGASTYKDDPEADRYIEQSIRTSKNPFVNSSIGTPTIDPQTGDVTYSAEHGRNNWLNNYNVRENMNSDEARKARQDALNTLIAYGKGDDRTRYESTVLKNMTEDEQREYSYRLGKYGREEAEKYLDQIGERVTNRRAAEIVENVNRDVVPEEGNIPTSYVNPRTGEVIENARSGKNPINTLAKAGKMGKLATQSGLDKLQSGISDKFTNYVTGGTEITPATAESRASEMVKEPLTGLGRIAYDVVENEAMMAPTQAATVAAALLFPPLAPAAASVGAGASVGSLAAAKVAADAPQIFGIGATMFPMSAGQAYEEGIQKGMTPDQARFYGTLEGLNQAAGEYLLGGFEDLSGGFAKQAVDNVLGNVVADETKSQAAQTVARAVQHFLTTPEGRMAFSMGSEAFEEIVQGSVSNALNNAFFGENNGPVSQEDLYSALIAALSAGMSNSRYYARGYANGIGRVYSAEDIRAAADNIITDRAAYVNQEAYDAAMEQRDQMLAQADYVEQGGNLTPLERSELGEAAGGALAEMDRIGRRARNESDIQEVTDALKTAQEIAQTEETKQEVEKISTRANDIIKRRAEGAQVTDAEVGRLINDTIRTTLVAGNEKAAATAEARTRMGFGEQGNTVMESSQATGQKAEALTALYEEARYDIQRNDAQKQLASTLLSEQEVSAMYQAGIQDRNAFYNTDYSDKIGKIAEKYRPGNIKRGNVTYDGVDMDALQKAGDNESRAKYAQMKTIEHFLAGTLGYNVEWFESKTADGKYEGENGSYNWAKHLIRLDINAGADVIGDKVKFASVIAHELTHTIENGSPMQYQKIANTVMKTLVADQEYSRGRNAEQIVADMIENNPYVKNEADAVHELVAQACEDMMNGNADIRAMFEGMSESERNTIFDHISNIFAAIKNFFDDLLNSDSVRSNRTEAAAIRRAKENIESLEKEWTEGVKRAAAYNAAAYEESQRQAAEQAIENQEQTAEQASENEQMENAFGDETGRITRDADGNAVIVESEDGQNMVCSLRTLPTTQAKLAEVLRRKGYSEESIKAAQDQVGTVADMLTRVSTYYAEMAEALDAELLVDPKTGKTVLHSFVTNGDYPVNIDFLTICKKREAYMHVLTDLIDHGIFDKVAFDGAAIATTNEILRDSGFETACACCFVESRRLQIQRWAETFCSEWNEEVLKRNPNATPFNFSKGDRGANSLTQEELIELDKELRSLTKKEKNDKGNYKIRQQGARAKMGPLLDRIPALGHTLSVGDLITPNGIDSMRALDSNLFSLVKQRYGTATPKIAQAFSPYNGDVADLNYGFMRTEIKESITGSKKYKAAAKSALIKEGIKKPSTQQIEDRAIRKYLYDIGGVRLQSFSDFLIENTLDYFQMFADLAAKELPLHAYSKEISFIKIFGMTGGKLNMSLIPIVDLNTDRDHAGLKKNKDGTYSYAGWGDYEHHLMIDNRSFIQSIGFKDAIALQLHPGYSSHVGTIAIGISNEHIKMMLNDPLIRMVIPYHSSGMLPEFAKQMHIDYYHDYTKTQNTTLGRCTDMDGNEVPVYNLKGNDSYSCDTHFDFNEAFQRLGDARMACEEYKEWCKQQHPVYYKNKQVGWAEFTPKFVEFADETNYYKLIEDFNSYDCITEEAAVQGAVTMSFPGMEQNLLNDEELKAYEERLRATGQFTEKEIQKYVSRANETLEEIVTREAKNRNAYHREMDKKYDSTLNKIEDTLQKNFNKADYDLVDNKYVRRDGEQKSARVDGYDESSPSITADTGVQHSHRVTDKATLDRLNAEVEAGDYITTYKAMQLIDGKLYPPMAAKVKDKDGKYRMQNASEIGVWQQADEDPAHIKIKNGRGYYTLNKGNGKSIDAAYNPYEHSSNLVLNDQFEEAYKRDNLVFVECRIPKSEIDNPYHAEYAKDATGVLDWKAGTVAGKLKNNRRQVYLSRYLMPYRILGMDEVAAMWKDTLGDSGIAVPFNVVPSALLTELEKAGVPIDREGSPNYRAHNKTQMSSRDSSGRELTEQQADYFKNSKIRDSDGNLQVMYHGTNADFNVFDTSVSGGVNGTAEGFGIYLADRSDVSDAYGDRLIKAYVNVTKPASSNKKTITRSTLKKLIKATAMSEAEKFVADGDYENVNDAVKDSWISNYTNTYEKSFSASLDDVANQLLRMDDNDMGIIQEVMAGMGIRDYADAYDFYDILKRVTGFDGFETWWTNAKNQGDPTRIVLAFDSNQVKNIDNEKPTESADIRFSSRLPIVRDKKVSKAQEKRDRGELLTERQFYQIYSAHKLNLRGLDNLNEQIENIKAEGFKGDGGFGNNVVPASINPRGYTEAEMLKDGYTQENINWKKKNQSKLWVDGRYYPSVNLTQRQYGARKGDTVMFVSEADLDVTKDTQKVKRGYRPFDYEIVTVERDYQPYYELYKKAYEQSRNNADVQYSSRINPSEYGPTFYSKLQREIQNFKGEKIGAASVESYLKGKGVKDEEIKWSGIRTFLEGKKSVNKQELMQYLRDNELQIEEKILGGDVDQNVWSNGYNTVYTDRYYDPVSNAEFKGEDDFRKEAVKRAAEDRIQEKDIIFNISDDYMSAETEDGEVILEAMLPDVYELRDAEYEPSNGTRWEDYKLDGGKNYREVLFSIPGSDYSNQAMQTHWKGDKGVLAHARLQDFDSADGGKVLFVEEIQSDWHNAAQKATTLNQSHIKKAKAASGKDLYYLIDNKTGNEITRATQNEIETHNVEDIHSYLIEKNSVPDAPFRNNYTDYVLKNLLRMAAEGDYDYLAWTTGKMQEGRWSDQYAEGYRIEYDQQIPKFLKKYGKQWGAGLTEVTVGENAVPAIVVNDAMKNSVLTEGQPMFSARSNGFDQRTSLGTVEELERRNENIWHINYTLDQVLRDRGAQTQKISDHQIKRIANRFIREYGSKADVDTIANGLKSMYEYIDSGAKTSAQQVGKIATAFAEQIIDESKDVDDTMAAMYPGLADDIKRTKLYVSPEAMKEMAYYFEGAADFRRQAKKFLTISERPGDGRGIDTFYEELSESYPELFDQDVVNEKDQLLQIFDVAEQLKAKTIDKDWGSEYDEVAYTLGQDLVAAYFAEKGDSSYKRSIDQIKVQMTKDHKEQMANLRRYKDQQIKEIKDKLTGERRVNTAQIAELRARLQEQYRQREEKASLRRLTTQAKAKLQRQARQLWSKRGTPEFERLKAKLFSELDLVSVGITKGGRLSLEKTYNEAKRQAALDPDYAASADYENLKLKFLGDPANPAAERKHLRDLSYDEIVDLTQDIIALKHSQQTYDKVLKENFEASVADYGRRGVAQQGRVKGILNQKGHKAAMLAAIKKYALYMENPVRAAHLLDGYQEGGVLTELFDDINDGTTKKTRFQQQANQMFEEILKDKKLTDGWSDQNIEINVGAGKYYISKGMRISIALHVRNADNIRHINFGGFKIPNEKLYKAGRYTDAYNAGTQVQMTEEEMKQIASEMTPEEKKFAGIAYQFFNHTTKDAINETSMVLKGYELAVVPNYMPIRTDPNFTQAEIDGLIHDGTIEGKGQFKDRQPGAKNPILLEDIAQVIERQTQTTAAYYGLAIPVRNMNKVWKYTATAYKASMKEAIAQNWGQLGKDTIEKMIKDIQAGARRGDTGDHVFSFLKGAQAASTLTMNLGVSIKQFASYPLAISMIDADCLMKGLKAKTDRAYIDSITPWSWDRRHGMGGEEMSDIFRQKGMIARNQTVQNIKNMVNWIQAVDVFTTDHLFSACEAQVQKDNPDLEVRGEEYNKKVAALYNDVLWRTQPSYGVMQRNELMRSASSIMKALTMYKTQTFNMGGEIIDAGLRAITMNDMAKNGFVSKDEAKKAGQDLKKVLWGTVLSQATLAALSAVAAAVLRKMRPYRDDKGEITAGSLMQKVGTDFITSWFGLFFGADLAEQAVGSVLNFAKWYDVTAPQLDGLNDTVSDMSAWSTALGDYIGEADADKKAEKKAKLAKTSAKMAMTTAGTFGVPTTNVYNMLNALNLLLQDVSEDGGGFLSFEAGEGLFGLTDTAPTKEQYARQAVYYSERDDAERVAHALKGTNKANLEKVLGSKLSKNLYESFLDDSENLAKYMNVKQGGITPRITDVPDDGYSSFTKLREAIGDPERTQNWHHIVEQEQGPGEKNFGTFSATQINNKNNIVSIPSGSKSPHSAISQYYGTVQDFTGGKTVREWLSTKSFEEQFDFGVKQLQKYGDIIPTGNGWVFVPDDKKIEALIPLSKGKKEEGTDTQKQWETRMSELREDGGLTGREVRDAALTMLKDGLAADEAIELYRSNQKSDKNLDKWKGGFEDYLNSRNAIDDAKAIKDSDKKRQKEKRKQAVEDYLRQYHGTKEDELLLWKLAGYGEKTFVYR